MRTDIDEFVPFTLVRVTISAIADGLSKHKETIPLTTLRLGL